MTDNVDDESFDDFSETFDGEMSDDGSATDVDGDDVVTTSESNDGIDLEENGGSTVPVFLNFFVVSSTKLERLFLVILMLKALTLLARAFFT